ncbi:MAG: hypothetical protein ACRD3J_22125 [Thermoanaerobaculia bacterium]
MDQELIAYLDERFREATQKITGLREEFVGFREATDQQFEVSREKTTQQIGGLREEFVGFREATNQQFEVSREETTQQIGGLREEFVGFRQETTQKFERLEERMDERFRHTGMEIEALRDNIRQVADGVAGANESLGALDKKLAAEFKEVRASIRAPFENLDKRVRVLEAAVLDKKQKKVKGRPAS